MPGNHYTIIKYIHTCLKIDKQKQDAVARAEEVGLPGELPGRQQAAGLLPDPLVAVLHHLHPLILALSSFARHKYDFIHVSKIFLDPDADRATRPRDSSSWQTLSSSLVIILSLSPTPFFNLVIIFIIIVHYLGMISQHSAHICTVCTIVRMYCT